MGEKDERRRRVGRERVKEGRMEDRNGGEGKDGEGKSGGREGCEGLCSSKPLKSPGLNPL